MESLPLLNLHNIGSVNIIVSLQNMELPTFFSRMNSYSDNEHEI